MYIVGWWRKQRRLAPTALGAGQSKQELLRCGAAELRVSCALAARDRTPRRPPQPDFMSCRHSAAFTRLYLQRFFSVSAPQRARHRSHYDALGVGHRADRKEIKHAFYELSKKHHPDRNPGNADAHKEFVKISEAYEILSDDRKRREYDLSLPHGHVHRDTSHHTGSRSTGYGPRRPAASRHFRQHDTIRNHEARHTTGSFRGRSTGGFNHEAHYESHYGEADTNSTAPRKERGTRTAKKPPSAAPETYTLPQIVHFAGVLTTFMLVLYALRSS
ncbi:hypothetical protein DFJ74DRAFT_241014 [Hyaloraphidium curvatum]|nr:hypothetical protein DFJ74DRAFT_241014 [Hyaloraphidium curvatum]